LAGPRCTFRRRTGLTGGCTARTMRLLDP
jgi:hypothetical protein